MLYKNNIGPQVRRKRYALGWSQSTSPRSSRSPASTSAAAASQRSKPRLRYVDDKSIMFLAEVLKAPGAGTLPTP